jgi:Spy/CpxP family protein refolding chaperone
MPDGRILRSLCLIALLVGAPTFSRAADSAAPATQPGEDRPLPQADPDMLLQRLREQLSTMKLTDDQQQKVEDVLNKAEQSLKLLDQELQNATQGQRAGRVRDILSGVREQIRSLLTPGQQQELRSKITSGARNRLQRLREGLAKIGLSDDQKQKIQSLLDSAQSELEQGRKAAGASTQDAAEKLRAAGAELREKLAQILTDEQREQLRDFMENSAAPTTQPAN